MSVENLINKAECLLWNDPMRELMFEDYRDMHKSLGGPGASERAAQVVIEACS